MSKSRKLIVIIFKSLLIIFLVVSFNLLMMPKYISENYDGRIVAEFYREKAPVDVLFLGSSTVYSGISPIKLYEDYGIASYVLASSSQTSWDSYYLLVEALKSGKPSLVVLDIGFMNQAEDYAEEVSNRKLFDYMKPSKNKFDAIKVAKAADENNWDYILPVLRYHERYKDLSIDDIKYLYYKPDVTYNGYIMNWNISESIESTALTLDNAADMSLNPKNAEYLQKIITLCNNEGIKLLLVKTPSYSAKWGHTFENDIIATAAAGGINYLNFDNYQDKMNLNWYTDSPDGGGHLNIIGAEKYTYCLGAVLEENYELPDRREDSVYSAIYNEKLDRYNNDKLEKIAQFGR